MCVEKIRSHPVCESIPGRTSPRMRRKLAETAADWAVEREISRYVEKTFAINPWHNYHRRHLHIRGENLHIVIQLPTESGTSPHTRRKQPPKNGATHILGDISAYAEKTEPFTNYLYLMREHLRVCGENSNVAFICICWSGTSPRA